MDKPNDHWKGLIGRWEEADEFWRTNVIEIAEKRGKPSISVVHKEDGEKLIVTNIHFEDGFLCFNTRVPSNKYKARHRLKLSSKNTMVQEITLFDKWVRSEEPTQDLSAS